MSQVFDPKEFEHLSEALVDANLYSVAEIKDYESLYRKQVRVGKRLVKGWKQGFSSDIAGSYLLESNSLTHFQLHVLSKFINKPWMRRQWLKVNNRFSDDIFDWLECLFKPQFRGVIKGIRELDEVRTVQWDWLVHTAVTLANAVGYPQYIATNLRKIASILTLKPSEVIALEFGLACSLDSDFDSFLQKLSDVDRNGVNVLSRALGVSSTDLTRILAESSTLKTIIFTKSGRFDFFMESEVKALLTAKTPLNRDNLLDSVARRTPQSELHRHHFDHLDISNVFDYLRTTLDSKPKGVNVLLYGPPGTGKTQLSRLFAQECKATLFNIDSLETDDLFIQKTRVARIKLAQHVLSRSDSTMLCVDECEDIFERTLLSGRSNTKTKLNDLLEESLIPTIWTTNWVHDIEPSLLRRFDIVVKVEPPTKAQKADMFKKQLQNLDVQNSFCERLASAETLAQGHIASASKVASALDYRGKEAETCIEQILQGQLEPMGETLTKTGYISETQYQPELVNVKGDNLADIQNMLIRSQQGRVLLFGPPGTGKTGFAYHFSEVCGLPLHHTRASDLLDPFVGGTEQKIAAAFAKAAQQKAVLLLDEADSLLTDRSAHHRNWETSQVNELLTQMECFQGILIASTNLEQRLDHAASRRFDFKLEFDYLKPEQAAALLVEISDAHSLSSSTLNVLSAMSKLTPGDFSVVKRKTRLMEDNSVSKCMELLTLEHEFKVKDSNRRIGFIN